MATHTEPPQAEPPHAAHGDGSALRTCLRRAFGVERNPLCRRTDRLRSWISLAVAVLLGLAPVAGFLVGGAVYRQAADRTAAQAAHRHAVTAVTERAATDAGVRIGPDREVPVTARWTYPGRQVQSGTVLVDAGTAAGAPVRVWVDDTGRLAPPPRSPVDMAADAWFAGVGTLAAVAGLTFAGAAGGRRLLDRRDGSAWERGWAEVEPGWSGRRPNGIGGP